MIRNWKLNNFAESLFPYVLLDTWNVLLRPLVKKHPQKKRKVYAEYLNKVVIFVFSEEKELKLLFSRRRKHFWQPVEKISKNGPKCLLNRQKRLKKSIFLTKTPTNSSFGHVERSFDIHAANSILKANTLSLKVQKGKERFFFLFCFQTFFCTHWIYFWRCCGANWHKKPNFFGWNYEIENNQFFQLKRIALKNRCGYVEIKLTTRLKHLNRKTKSFRSLWENFQKSSRTYVKLIRKDRYFLNCED